MTSLKVWSLLLALSLVPLTASASEIRINLNDASRNQANKQRDVFRHPAETIAFFGVKPSMTVIEMWPGKGWYTELLAPWIKQGKGEFISAGFPKQGGPKWRHRIQQEYENWLALSPARFDAVQLLAFGPPDNWSLGESNSADAVLTFRNVHNWLKGNYADKVFKAMFDVLKPNGILGVTDHRAAPGSTLEYMNASGYITEEKVIELAEQAGFLFVEKSDINANPKDLKNHPKGVWTLPPSLRLGEQDKSKYLAIGESDRMTLKFVKP